MNDVCNDMYIYYSIRFCYIKHHSMTLVINVSKKNKMKLDAIFYLICKWNRKWEELKYLFIQTSLQFPTNTFNNGTV